MSQIIMMKKLLRVYSDRCLSLGHFWQKGCQQEEYQNFILNMIKQLMKVQKYQSYWIQLFRKKFDGVKMKEKLED